jgi:hypothetical protein
VQVEPTNSKLKPPGTMRLKLRYDGPLSNFAFNLNLRCYGEAGKQLLDQASVNAMATKAGPDRYCLPRHRMLSYSRNEDPSVSMTWRAMGLADIARHVIGCHFTQEMRIQMRVNDVAGDGPATDIARHVIGCQFTQ